MKKRKVWVELDVSVDVNVVRIFKNRVAAARFVESSAQQPNHRVVEILKASAVGSIRRQVFKRDGFTCVHCGASVTWLTGHMHEREWKGRGGEVSVANCVTLCYSCHLNDPVAGHGKRKPQFTGKYHG